MQFSHGESEAQRGQVTGPRSHREDVKGQNLAELQERGMVGGRQAEWCGWGGLFLLSHIRRKRNRWGGQGGAEDPAVRSA